MAYRSTGIARQLFNTAAVASCTSKPTAVPVARTFASVPSRSNASTSSSVTLDQLRKPSQPSASIENGSLTATVTAAESDAVSAAPDEEQFVLPNCLLPTEALERTHGIHVATLHLRSYEDGRDNLELFADFRVQIDFPEACDCNYNWSSTPNQISSSAGVANSFKIRDRVIVNGFKNNSLSYVVDISIKTAVTTATTGIAGAAITITAT